MPRGVASVSAASVAGYAPGIYAGCLAAMFDGNVFFQTPAARPT